MIGRSCKRCEALRRAVLIGRALHLITDDRDTDRILRSPRDGAPCGPQGALDNGIPSAWGPPPAGATMERGSHPNPSRTRQLSPSSPKVLRLRPWEDRASRPQGALPYPDAQREGAPMRGPFPFARGLAGYGGNVETRLIPCKGAGRGVYYHLARRTGVRMARRTLKTGYCESKTDSMRRTS